jgi:hypothetical protein
MNRNLWISTISLIAANLVSIVLAVIYSWDVKTLMLIYWSQSVIIGIFQFIKIMNLKNFSTEGFGSTNVIVGPNQATKNHVLRMFPIYYGIFLIGYLLYFGLDFLRLLPAIILPVAIFLINHYISYRQHKGENQNKVLNIGILMFLPFIRTVPMHFAICAAVYLSHSAATLIIFLVLKMIADVIMHIVEHRMMYG